MILITAEVILVHCLNNYFRRLMEFLRVAAGRVRTRGSSVFTRSWHGAGPFFENGPVCRGGAVPYFQRDPRGGSIFEDPPRTGYYPEDPRVLYIITRSKNGSLLWVLV